MSLLSKVLGDPHKREVSRHRRAVEQINALEEEMKALSDDELAAKTVEFRERIGFEGPDLSFGQSYADGLLGDDEEDIEAEMERREKEEKRSEAERLLGDVLPEAFATVREMSLRILGMRHFDVQLIGAMVLHEGKISEMRTGEGKTLVATLALYLNALPGHGAHLVTVNDYLARRDAGWNAPLYHALGMRTGIIAGQDLSFVYDPEYLDQSHPDPRLQHLRPCDRREAYAADITYATNNELGFDYLRDNMSRSIEDCVQRRLWFAIVDEVDSILVDEARTPLIISGEGTDPTDKYYTYSRLIPRLKPEDDYTLDEKTKSAALTDDGVAKIEQWSGVKNIFDIEHTVEAHQVNQALRAHALYQKDRDYIVTVDREVVIVDEFTGRTMPGRRWSDGLHQAIEAKEGVSVQQENITLATITFQNFFRIYHKLSGMTGTAITEAEEFDKIYKLDVVPIPTNRPNVRKDEADLIFKSADAKYRAVVDDIAERYETGQPVLVGTTSIEKSERIARLLEKKGIPHSVLNAKMHESEAQIIADAGKKSIVTIATNMAGRGTDIVLGDGVDDVGGLYIIGTERHESRRIDNQLRGRAGRQGDPGETRFYLSFEDDLMRIFGGERMQGMMDRLLEDDGALESKLVTRQIEGAQSRVEGFNFDSRRHVVEYDDVMNRQREIIYGERRKILEGSDTKTNFLRMLARIVAEEVPTFCEGRNREAWDLEGLWQRMRQFAPPLPAVGEVNLGSLGDSVDEVTDTLTGEITAIHEELEEKHGAELIRRAEQVVMLHVVDERWRSYLTQMEHLREGTNLSSYAQLDPLIEYKQQAFESFQELTAQIEREIVTMFFATPIEVFTPSVEPPTEAAQDATAPASARADQAGSGRDGDVEAPPPARPAAAAASGRLNKAAAGVGLLPPPVRNVVQSSSAGTERVAGNGNTRVPNRKMGRNESCWCGSGKKYKFCHGR
ncbi:MAG: preprotein translocase subunit SecA [Candidatus Dormibacteria bacterium]